jgi:hypothetical protein
MNLLADTNPHGAGIRQQHSGPSGVSIPLGSVLIDALTDDKDIDTA